MYRNSTVCVIVPAYNEEESIAAVVRSYRENPHVDRVLVVNNNSTDRTEEIARMEGAEVVRERDLGYGRALRRGLDEAHEDLLVLTEADNSFAAADLEKLLAYAADVDLVLGSRTCRQFIGPTANMGPILIWGNLLFAKILQLLYGPLEYRFTDIGCTYRLIHREKYRAIRPRLQAPGTPFSPEMMVEAARANLRIVQIPVHYGSRLAGRSKNTPNLLAALRHGMEMLWLIVRKRFDGNRDRLPHAPSQ